MKTLEIIELSNISGGYGWHPGHQAASEDFACILWNVIDGFFGG